MFGWFSVRVYTAFGGFRFLMYNMMLYLVMSDEDLPVA